MKQKENNQSILETNMVCHKIMKELPPALLPYEKCKLYGPGRLSDEELLAVILRSGTRNKRVTQVAREVMSLSEQFGGLVNLCKIPISELMKIEGIGEVKAVVLLCLGELSVRIRSMISFKDNQVINSSSQAATLLMDELKALEVEEVWALFLDAGGSLVKKSRISVGSINSSMLPVREIIKEALKYGAVGIILAHNHPSGNIEPSMEDIKATSFVKRAGELMEIKLLDHLIIGNGEFLSMKARNLL